MKKTTLNLVLLVSISILIFSCKKDLVKESQVQAQSDSENATQALKIGKKYGGGVIFYLDDTKQHGLIAALQDQSSGVKWDKGNHFLIGAKGSDLGSGKKNTNKIVKALGNKGSYAALICKKYRGGGYSDWFLPSKAELNKLYNKRSVVGGFSGTNYWSSTEADADNAWDQVFQSTTYKFADSKGFTLRVRAIRAF